MITHGAAARILAKISAYDQRTVGETDIRAWAEALDLADPPIDLADALAAVAAWHATALDGRMRPAHVIQGAQTIARRRAGAERAAALAGRMEIAAGPLVRDASDERLLAELRVRLGTGDRSKLRRAEWVERDRREQRARDAVPNPLFGGFPPPGGFPVPTGDGGEPQ